MIVIIIPAKGGSSRLPNKNMAKLNGRPMLDYAIDHALASERAQNVYVTTDSDIIEDHSAGRNVTVIRRPESLGGDTPMVDVLNHAIQEINDPEISIVVSLQPDHPDRNTSVDQAIRRFEQEGADLLHSKDANDNKNGAHHIMTIDYLRTGKSKKTIDIVDDCTNIHYQEDLNRAALRLKENDDQIGVIGL